MAKSWRDIFEIDKEISDAVNAAVSDAVAKERRTSLYVYVQNGDMRLENAARNAGIPADEFASEMTSLGYKIP